MNAGTLDRENLRRVSHLHHRSLRGWAPGRSWMGSPTLAVSLLLAAATFGLRLAYAATRPTDAAGAALVRGAARFDVTRASPEAPGSWLFVAVGHLLHLAGTSPVGGLVLLAALLSSAATAATAVAGTGLGGPFLGAGAGAFVATAPVSWFAGSTVSTAAAGALLGAVLIVLALRARPGSAHGALAAAVLGAGAGIRLSAACALALLALIAVVGSVRTVGQLLATAAVGLAAVAVWFVPVLVVQPGGPHAWFHALDHQVSTAAAGGSPFAAPATVALTNLGTAAGWSLVTLAPVVVLGLVGVLVLFVARIATRRPAGDATLRIWAVPGGSHSPATERARFQAPAVVLVAALLPPVALVLLGRFTGGGDVLSYVVPATLVLLLPAARLVHHRARSLRTAATVAFVVLGLAAVALNVDRFAAAPAILPATVVRHHPGWWISEPRYGSPYDETAHAIAVGDRDPPTRADQLRLAVRTSRRTSRATVPRDRPGFSTSTATSSRRS